MAKQSSFRFVVQVCSTVVHTSTSTMHNHVKMISETILYIMFKAESRRTC